MERTKKKNKRYPDRSSPGCAMRMIIAVLCVSSLASGLLCPLRVFAGEAPTPVVRSAAEIDYPPFSIVHEDGIVDGFSIELMRAVLLKMGYDVTFQTGPWSEVRGWLERGEVDALPLVGRTPEREHLFDFTVPYMTMHGAIVVREEMSGVRTLGDLRGRRVGVMKGDNAEEFLRREERDFEIVTTPTFTDAFHALAEGRLDAVVIQRLVAVRLLEETGLADLKIVEKPVRGFSQDFCFAVREGNREMLSVLNEGLALSVADGTHRRLHSKWFAHLELPSDRPIIVGGDHNYPPFEFLDGKGRPAGFTVEVTRAIAREMNMDVRIQLGPWEEMVDALREGEIDALEGAFYSPERDRILDFSPRYLVIHCVGVVRKGEGPPPEALEELEGRDLVVQAGDAILDALAEHGIKARITTVETQEDVVRAVAEGKSDCGLMTRFGALHAIKKNGWTNIEIGDKSIYSGQYGYAVAQGNDALLAQFTEGLQTLKDSGEYQRIYEKWLGAYEPVMSRRSVFKYIAMIAGPLLLISILALLWSWSLRRQVSVRTRELRESEERFRVAQEMSPDGFTILHPVRNDKGEVVDFTWVYENQAIARINGTDPQKVIGERVLDLFPSHNGTPVFEAYLNVANTGKPRILEDVYVGEIISNPTWLRIVVVSMCEDIAILSQDITESRRAGEALRESELKYRLLADNTVDCIWLMGMDLVFEYINPAIEQMTGWTTDEWIGTNIKDHCDEENFKKMTSVAMEAVGKLPDTSGLQFEAVMLKKNGEPFYVEITGRVLLDDSGAPVGLQGVTRDITERKRAEEEIHWVTQRNALLSDTAARLLETENPQGLVEELCGRVMEFLDCQAFFNFLNDDREARLRLNACAGIPEEETQKIEWLDYGAAVCGCVARDGCRIIAEDIQNTADSRTELVKSYGIQAYCCHPLTMEGVTFGTLSFGTATRPRFSERDVAVMKEIADMVSVAMRRIMDQNALRKSEERYRLTLDGMLEGCQIITPDWKYVYVNEAAARQGRKSRDELIGRTMMEAYPGIEESVLFSVLRECMRERVPRRYDNEFTYSDGARGVFQLSIEPVAEGLFILSEDITEQKRAQEALLESEARFRAYVDKAPDGIFITDETGKYIDVNPAASRMTGYSREELCSMSIADLLPPESQEQGLNHFRKLKAEGRSEGEILFRTKDGSTKWWTVDAVRLRHNRFLGFCKDITDRKQAENALRESEQRFRSIYDNMSVGIAKISLDYKVKQANAAYCRMLGYSEDQLIGKHLKDITHPEIIEENLRLQAQLARGEIESFRLEKRFIHKNGNTVYGILVANLIRNAAGNPAYFLGSVLDVTHEKKLDAEIEKQQNLLDSLLKALPAPVFCKDRKGRYLSCNPAFEQATGRTQAEIIGRTAKDIWPEKHSGTYIDKDMELLETGGEQQYEYKFVDPDGNERDVIFYKSTFEERPGDVAGIVGVMLDITERKLAERQLVQFAEQNQAIFDLNKIHAKSSEEILDYALELSLKVTRSDYGFFGLMDDGESSLLVHSWSRDVMAACNIEEKTCDFSIENTGLWGDCVRLRRPIIVNDYAMPHKGKKGTPEGHVAINRFMSVPIFKGDRIIAVAAVANRDSAYTKEDADALAAVVGKSMDLLEHLDSEKALRKSEEKFRAIFENMASGCCINEVMCENGEIVNYRILDVNPAYERIIGIERDRALGSLATELYGLEKAPFLETYGRVTETGEHASFEAFFAPAGKHLHISVTRPAPGRFSTSFVDVSEQKKLEREIEKRRLQYKALIESSADHVFMLDHKGNFIASNDRVEHWQLASGKELIGRHFNEFQDDKTCGLYESALNDIWSEGESVSFEHTFTDSSGVKRHHIDTLYPVRTGDEIWAVGGICKDITELKNTEEKLVMSQKMEAIGQLAGGVAHDFNNLLTVIINYCEMILLPLREEAPLRADVKQILDAGERAATLTRQLLAFSRKQIMQPEIMNLNKIAADMEKMLRRLIGENIDLVFKQDDKLRNVNADPGQMEQVIMNLAVNARDAMPDGGKLTLETLNVRLDEDYCETHPDVAPGDYVMLAVSDTGDGMSQETMKHIFEPFFTTKEKGKGTGLGLATVYGIAKQSEAHIWVYSEPGEGSAFKIYFPAVYERADSRTREEICGIHIGTETILIVEDELSIRNLAHRILESFGYKVLEAANGGEAMILCEKAREPIHLMITDVVMPGMSGRELAERLRKVRPDMEILYMSGYTENAIVHHGVLDQGTHFIGKPFSVSALTSKVRSILDKKS